MPWLSRDEICRSTVEISCPAPREPPVYPAQPCPCWLGKQEVHYTGSVGWRLLKDFIHIPWPSSLQAQVHLAERMGRAWPHPSLAPGSFIPSTPIKKKKRKLRSKKNALEAFYPKYLHYQNVARLTLAPLPRRLQCDCQHNTCGGSCDRCCPGFNQFPWKPATADSANECQRKLEPGFSFLFPAVRRAQVGRASPAPRRCSAAKSFTKMVWFVVCSTGCSVDEQRC